MLDDQNKNPTVDCRSIDISGAHTFMPSKYELPRASSEVQDYRHTQKSGNSTGCKYEASDFKRAGIKCADQMQASSFGRSRRISIGRAESRDDSVTDHQSSRAHHNFQMGLFNTVEISRGSKITSKDQTFDEFGVIMLEIHSLNLSSALKQP